VCAEYCTVYMANCAANGTQYADEQACLDACAGWDVGTPADTAGDTTYCRIYHAGAAAGDPVTHCPHSQEVPDGGCV
jgi:hypothetical protein